MYILIERFINKMTRDDIKNFAIKKGANLSEEELNFTYNFIKTNYKQVLSNPKLLDLDRYKNNYTKENFEIISKVFQEYSQKYSNYL